MCMLHFKQQRKRWVAMIDLDEYLLVNPSVQDQTSPAYLPGSKTPSMEEPHSVIHFASKYMSNSCVVIARRQFAPIYDSNESSLSRHLQQLIPDFDTSRLQTLRWKKWGYIENTYGCKSMYIPRVLWNKAMVDLGGLQETTLRGIFANRTRPDIVHEPLFGFCPGAFAGETRMTPIVANHYPGTLQQMMHRSLDARQDQLHTFASLKDRYGREDGHEVLPWLAGFIDFVGEEEALRLLEGAGEIFGMEGKQIFPMSFQDRLFSANEKVQVRAACAPSNSSFEDGIVIAGARIVIASAMEFEMFEVLYPETCRREWPVEGRRMRRNADEQWKC
ncbi:MAG: hypothetical protein SGILL_004255 [Bacillariaceae sp.]